MSRALYNQNTRRKADITKAIKLLIVLVVIPNMGMEVAKGINLLVRVLMLRVLLDPRVSRKTTVRSKIMVQPSLSIIQTMCPLTHNQQNLLHLLILLCRTKGTSDNFMCHPHPCKQAK